MVGKCIALELGHRVEVTEVKIGITPQRRTHQARYPPLRHNQRKRVPHDNPRSHILDLQLCSLGAKALSLLSADVTLVRLTCRLAGWAHVLVSRLVAQPAFFIVVKVSTEGLGSVQGEFVLCWTLLTFRSSTGFRIGRQKCGEKSDSV